MPDRKLSVADEGRRIGQEVTDVGRPWYLLALAAFLKVFFIVYDSIVYIPFKIFADPEKKLELSRRVKARQVDKNEPASPWRHVDTIDTKLWDQFPGIDNLGKLWDEAVRLHGEQFCMGTRTVCEVFEERPKNGRTFQKLVLGDYEWLDYLQVNERITSVAFGLRSLGIKKGQHVVIYADTRMEWMVSAIACFKSGFPVVTVYPTLGEEAIKFAIEECDAVAIFTTRNLLSTVLPAIKNCPDIKHIVYFPELHQHPDHAKPMSKEEEKKFTDAGRNVHSFDSLINLGASSDSFTTTVDADKLAMMMYTSGTTGNPKGVCLSHKNIIAAITGQSAVIEVGVGDVYIGYLPLAHILEVCAELVVLYKGCKVGYSSAQTLFDRAPKIKKGSKGDCAALKPTLIACVPAIMDRIFKAVSDEVKEKSAIQRELFRICYERKRARYEKGYTSLIANGLVFDRIRKILGGHLRIVLSGGAPLNPETQRFMNICFCCPVVQGYGLTETCGGATLADVHDLSTGSVGPPLRCCEIMLREWAEAGYFPSNGTPQGEILIHGANVAMGYHKNEEKTNEDFVMVNGKRWFATGDIGEFRKDGSLLIIDRKKDLIKLAHGEYISLGKVETNLLTNPLVDNICVCGNGYYDFLVALVVPNQKNLFELAEKVGVPGKNFETLCKDSTVLKSFVEELQKFASGKLSRTEVPQRVFLCTEPWTPQAGLLTEALKLKRKAIEKAFRVELQQLYGAKSIKMGNPLKSKKLTTNQQMKAEPSTGVVCGKGLGLYYIFCRDFPKEVQLDATQLPSNIRSIRLGQWVQFLAEKIGDTFSVIGLKLVPSPFPTLPITDLVVAIECQLFIPSTRLIPNQAFKSEVSDEVYDQKNLVQDRHLGQSCRGTIGYYHQNGRGIWLVEFVE